MRSESKGWRGSRDHIGKGFIHSSNLTKEEIPPLCSFCNNRVNPVNHIKKDNFVFCTVKCMKNLEFELQQNTQNK